LLEQASALSSADQQRLLDHLSLAARHLRFNDSQTERDLGMWAAAVGAEVSARTSTGTMSGCGPLLLRKLLGAATSWAQVQDFMRVTKLAELSVVERQSVYNLLAQLLLQYAERVSERTGAPLTPKLVCSCASSIAGIFDSAFPGYAASGLAPIMARRLCAAR